MRRSQLALVGLTLVLCLQCGRDPGESRTAHDAAPGASIDASTASLIDAAAGPDAAYVQTVADCFEDAYLNTLPSGGPDYDQYQPLVGSHCLGTNHQDITNIERVVFLGDSVTVGTPPTISGDYYRSKLADSLASKFGLSAPSGLWKTINPIDGTSLLQSNGAFSSCAKWGARTTDLMPTQLPDCFPNGTLAQRTLVVMTMGGNDLHALSRAAINDAPESELWQMTEDIVVTQRAALDWLRSPGRFPNGVFVVFSNIFEFTDGTGDVESCDVSGLAGFDDPIPQPLLLAEMVIWANEQYLKMAVETGTDMLFMLEEFCGHGLKHDDPSAACYRGPDAEQWIDLTCIHPNPVGHSVLADMFLSMIEE